MATSEQALASTLPGQPSELAAYFSEGREFVNAGLARDVQADVEPSFQERFDYTLLDPSAKRVRAVLALITADALEQPWDEVLHLASGIEKFHGASLIQDDMPDQDNSPVRRGKPSAHIAFGERRAREAGSLMVVHAFLSMARADTRHGLNGGLSIYASHIVSGIHVGQSRDLDTFQTEAGANTTLRDLDEIASLKAGLFIEMSIGGVAMIAKASNTTREHLATYSKEFGIALQVSNDLLDPVQRDDDARHGKPNYLSVLGGPEATQKKLRLHVDQAVKAVEPLASEIDITRLSQLATYIGSQAHDSLTVTPQG